MAKLEQEIDDMKEHLDELDELRDYKRNASKQLEDANKKNVQLRELVSSLQKELARVHDGGATGASARTLVALQRRKSPLRHEQVLQSETVKVRPAALRKPSRTYPSRSLTSRSLVNTLRDFTGPWQSEHTKLHGCTLEH